MLLAMAGDMDLGGYATVGTAHHAEEAWFTYENTLTELEAGRVPQWNLLAEGSYRTALLHVPTRIVYKIPRELGAAGDANPAEAEYWTMMRQHPEYAEFVPPHTLWVVAYGQFRNATAMAMHYYPDEINYPFCDVPLDLVHASEHVGCHDANGRNVRRNSGRWLLIDAGGSEHWDDPTEFGPGPGDGCADCNPSYRPGGTRTIHVGF